MKTEAECLEYLNSINIPCLTDSDTQTCEGRLTIKECRDELHSVKTNKSPGNDGITKGFLKYFWGKLGTFLVLNAAYDGFIKLQFEKFTQTVAETVLKFYYCLT